MKPKTALLTGLILIILATAGMYVTGGEVNTEAETIDTSDWVTYRNEELGFEVKHPEGWRVRQMVVGKDEHVIFRFSLGEKDYAWVLKRLDENMDLMQLKEKLILEYKNLPRGLGASGEFIENKSYGEYPGFIFRTTLRQGDLFSRQDNWYIDVDGRVWSFFESVEQNGVQIISVDLVSGFLGTLKFLK